MSPMGVNYEDHLWTLGQWLTFLKPILFEKLDISQCSGLVVNAPTGFCIWIPGSSVGGAIWGVWEACPWQGNYPRSYPTPHSSWACGWEVSCQLPAEAAVPPAAMLPLTLRALTFLNRKWKQSYSSTNCFGPGVLSQELKK